MRVIEKLVRAELKGEVSFDGRGAPLRDCLFGLTNAAVPKRGRFGVMENAGFFAG
jgi:hypothetical protein